MANNLRSKLLHVVLSAVVTGVAAMPSLAQNNDYYRQQQQQQQQQADRQRQQDQQRQQEQQRQRDQAQQAERQRVQDQMRQQQQQAMRQQMQDQARLQQQQAMRQQMQQQAQSQQRQQAQSQQRQQAQDQQRRQAQDQQRQATQTLQRQQAQGQQQAAQQKQQQAIAKQQQQTADDQRARLQAQGRLGRDGKPTGMTVVGGVAKMNRPLTPGEISRGFTGKVTPDGRALVKYQNRIFTVPASRISGLSARLALQQNRQNQTSWTAEKVSALHVKATALAGSFNEAATRPGSSQLIPVQARQRQSQMMKDNVGFNVTPTGADRTFKSIGANGTFLTDQRAMESLISGFQSKGNKIEVSKNQARKIESELGLAEDSLDKGFRIRRIENLRDLSPRSPVDYSTNSKFKGAGQHLPGGHPEMVVDSVLSESDRNVSRTIEVVVK